MVNDMSLNSGEFADDLKCGLINPILKKPGLDLLYKNYRPVSNLQYVSKLTEKVAFNQVYDHMVSSQPPPQALRFLHGRGEREKRVTGDEPQGTVGRVQTAGERLPDLVSFSWHGPIFGLCKSWKRSILVAYCCKHCKL